MLCPKCKKEIPDGTQFCSECGANVNAQTKKQKKSIVKKWWFWLIIVVVAVAVISTASGGSSTDVPADSDNVAEQNDTVTTAENVAETTTEAAATGDRKYHVGDVVKCGDVEITYVSAEKWTGYNQYAAPASGNMIVRVAFDVVNNGTVDFTISSFEFKCYADNQAVSEYWNADDYISATVSSGRNASGCVYFEVPENAESIEIEYETNFWTSEKAVFVVEL